MPDSTPAKNLEAALKIIYGSDYKDAVEPFRTMYIKSLGRQWIASRDMDWSIELAPAQLGDGLTMGGIPIHRTRFWSRLSDDAQMQITLRSAGFTLSNFWHGEQGALLVAGQLVNSIPDMDGKFFASVQTVDEARHLEAISAYLAKIGQDRIRPIAPALEMLLGRIFEASDWMFKLVGMQVIVEGLALFTFRDMRNATKEPLLRTLLTHISQDEARHTAFGIKYLTATVDALPDADRAELEDFAFEATRLLVDSTAGASMRAAVFELWKEIGVDPLDVVSAMAEEADVLREAFARERGRRSAITAFVLPTLKAVGLLRDRIVSRYEEMFDRVRAEAARPPSRYGLYERLPELPSDLEEWTAEQAEPHSRSTL